MLLRVLKQFFRGRREKRAGPPPEFENEKRRRLDNAHAHSPMRRHLEIGLGDLRIGDHDLRALSDRCLADSDSRALPLKALHRPLASYFLARYFLHALELDGAYAECGVFRGTSALFLCRAALTRRPGYAGENLHLIDSFEGISRPVDEDRFDARGADGSVVRTNVPAGSLSSPVEVARKALRDFPAASFHHGWIPGVFAGLPETRWAFVHIDVDLYEATRDCLEYFFPRLCGGGVIVCDDYLAPLFPGAHRAWDGYCERHGVPFVVLDTGQSVILKTS
jgi:O-methyltransferase